MPRCVRFHILLVSRTAKYLPQMAIATLDEVLPGDDPVSTGTTIMAFKYKDGIILAADGRTSSGSYVESRVTDKLTPITDNIYCCRSGSAADTQRIARYVTKEIKLISCKENSIPSVHKTARLVKRIIYENERLLAAMIIAGYDGSSRVYKINACGTITEDDIIIGGSGSAYIYGFCDREYRPGMTKEEGISFARTAVGLAIKRDCSSGGIIRIATITKDGVQRFYVPGEVVYSQ